MKFVTEGNKIPHFELRGEYSECGGSCFVLFCVVMISSELLHRLKIKDYNLLQIHFMIDWWFGMKREMYAYKDITC